MASTSFVDNDGVRIAWESVGSGHPLLMVMGHRWSRRMWHPIIGELQSRYRVISFDNRGSGQSDDPAEDYTIADMSGDALRVLEAAGVDRAHVYGVSMGGVIAQDLALHHAAAVDHLVLGCTVAVTADRLRLTPSRQLSYFVPDRITNFISRPLLYGTTSRTPEIKRDLAALAQERTRRPGLLGQARAVSRYEVDLDGLRQLSHPTLVLHGAKDKVVPAEWGRELASLIPGAHALVFERAGHNYMATHASESNAAVTAFLP